MKDTHELLRFVAVLPVGKKAAVKVLREGQLKELQLTVAEREEKKELASGRGESKDTYGMSVQDITPDMAKQLGLPSAGGVIVTRVREGSAADEGGLQPYDVILQVNRVKVSSVRDFQREISKKNRYDRILLLITGAGDLLRGHPKNRGQRRKTVGYEGSTDLHVRRLDRSFGPLHWWPGDTPFEVAVGAILTQNTNGPNVQKAIGGSSERAWDRRRLRPRGRGLWELIEPRGISVKRGG